jgi:hypothetical protein
VKVSFYIAVNPSPTLPNAGIAKPDDLLTNTNNWAIPGAIILAAMPHLWQWIGGHQKARNNLTDKLLQNLTDSYKLVSVSSEGFRKIIEEVAEKPTELAERNALSLRDLSAEVADLRGQIINLNRKVDAIATMLTRQAQDR